MKKTTRLFVGTSLLTFLLAGCASQMPNNLSSNEPMAEISKLEADQRDGLSKQYDVLAHDYFKKSQESLKDAKAGVANKRDNAYVLNQVVEGRDSLDKAAKEAAEKTNTVPNVMAARLAAINAGASYFPETHETLNRLDDDLRSGIDDAKNWRVTKTSEMQNKYLDLELAAITSKQLSKASASIEHARAEGAKSLTPKAWKAAESDYANAKNIIASNRNEPTRFSEAVKRANHSADYLDAVITAAKRGNKELDETTAAGIVAQERKISQMQTQMGDDKAEGDRKLSRLQTQLGDEKDESAKLNDALATQGQKLKTADDLVDLQKTIEAARAKFSTSEAEVFQQGNTLLVRLKSIQFANNRAELPTEAMPILAKVKEVAMELGPKAVTVEGHTDSTGDAKKNQRLSQARAKAVSDYFSNNGIASEKIKTVGYGYQKPIGVNKTKEGRSQNRRVDVIITPDNGKTTTTMN